MEVRGVAPPVGNYEWWTGSYDGPGSSLRPVAMVPNNTGHGHWRKFRSPCANGRHSRSISSGAARSATYKGQTGERRLARDARHRSPSQWCDPPSISYQRREVLSTGLRRLTKIVPDSHRRLARDARYGSPSQWCDPPLFSYQRREVLSTGLRRL